MADASNTGATAPPSSVPSPPPRRKRPWRTAATVAALAVVLTLGLAAAHRPLLVGLAYLLRVDDPAPSDAIVLLLGGETHRPRKAANCTSGGSPR